MSAPAVTVKEVDLSTRVPSFPGVYAGIVIQALKGPVDKVQLITNDTQLLKVFTPNETVEVGMDNAFFSALAFLQKGNKLWVARAAKQAKYAGLSVRTSASSYNPIAIVAGLADPTAYAFDANPDVAAIAEITALTATQAGSFYDVVGAAKALTLSNGANAKHYFWFSVSDGTNTQTDPGSTGTGHEVVLLAADTAAQVAFKLAAIINGVTGFACPAPAGAVATVTNSVAGAADDADITGSGFTANVTTQGAAAVSADDEAFLLYNINPGAWGSDIGIKLTKYSTDPDKVKEPGAFLIEIFKSGNEVVPVESKLCSRVPGTKDGYGNNIYIEDALKSSTYLNAIDNVAIASSVEPKDIATVTYLAGGDNGLAVSDAEMILAADLFSNKDELPVTLLMDGGFATPAYGQALDTIAQNRGDCVAILSTPFSAEASASYIDDIVDYRKTTLNLNSSYSMLYTPHAMIYDKFNDRQIYVAPDGYAAAAISFTASNYELWYPAAGYKRGLMTVLDLRRRFTKGEMDVLYDAGVNPIRFTPGKGIAIWGQKTLLSRPSALDRANVRLLLCVIEPAIADALESFLFELNDTATRGLATATIDTYLSNIKSKKGVTDYLVVCDDTNNTADDIDNYRMNVDVFIKPTRSVEYIPLRIVIVASSLSFAQAAGAI